MKIKRIIHRFSTVTAIAILCTLLLGYSNKTPMLASVTQGASAHKSPTYSVSPLSDAYLAYLANGENEEYIPSTIDFSYLSDVSYSASNESFPSTFDLRLTGKSTPVRDQGQYGTCWTHGTLAAAESDLVERYPMINLSERFIAWFAYGGERGDEFFGAKSDPFNQGGYTQTVVGLLSQWIGAVKEEKAPYNGEGLPEEMRYESDWHMEDAFYLPEFPKKLQTDRVDNSVIKSILMNNGAVAISYTADYDRLNSETFAWYNSEQSEATHQVTCIGWDDNYPKENFLEGKRPQNNGAWLCKNSWNVSWGINGYFWLSYEDQTFSDGCFINLAPNDNYQNLYQYDLSGWYRSLGYESNNAYGANIFKSERDEEIDAVSFYTTDANAEYTINIYKNLTNMNDPTSGIPAITPISGNEEYAGYHTIELNTPVILSKGDSFSIVIQFTNPVYKSPVAIEAFLYTPGTTVPETAGKIGESYVSKDGENWEDVYKTGKTTVKDVEYDEYLTNVCIKAFTNPVRTVTFSEESGSIAFGSTVKLTAPGNVIYYTTDGTEPTLNSAVYTEPLVIERDVTIKAAAYSDGVLGAVREKSYTQSNAYLSSILVDPVHVGSTIQYVMNQNTFNYSKEYLNTTEQIEIIPLGSGVITINGIEVISGRGSTINLNVGMNNFEIVSTDEGKLPVTYNLSIYRSPVSFNFEQETIQFDNQHYQINEKEDFSGEMIHNGDNISQYINRTVYIRDEQNIKKSLKVPNRYQFSPIPIDFINEVTVYGVSDATMYSTNYDMSGAVYGDFNAVTLTPGVNVYFKRPASSTYFASDIYMLEVPNRPAMPTDPGINYVNETTKHQIQSEISFARNDDLSDAKSGSGTPVSVIPGEKLYLFCPATETSFRSQIREIHVNPRPFTPAQPPIMESSTQNEIILSAVNGAEYRCDGGSWQSSPVFTGLTPNTSYSFEIRIAADQEHFNSLSRTMSLSTLSPETTPGGITNPNTYDTGYKPYVFAALLLILVSCRVLKMIDVKIKE